jgi:uncharacterized SAM-binding protein YcdF (DUF218 family)
MTDAEATRFLFRQDEPRQANVALVFGSNEQALSQARARHAAWLYQNGFAPLIVLTGGAATPETLPEASFMARILADHRIPNSAMLLEAASRNTIENIRNSLRLLDQQGFIAEPFKVLLVSCPWHMRRILEISRRLFPIGTVLVSTPHSERCTAGNWSESADCRCRVQNELRLLRATPLVSSFEDTGD